MKQTLVTLLVLLVIGVPLASDTKAQGIWTKDANNPLLSPSGPGVWDKEIATPWVIFNADSNRYEMWYTGGLPHRNIGFAVSNDGIHWTKDSLPVLTTTPNSWDSMVVAAPAVIRENGEYKMWYSGTSKKNDQGDYSNRIGYATSSDGRQWTKYGYPIFSVGTANWESYGVEYCSVLKVTGGYLMFYGGIDTSKGRIGRAFSGDGITWTRDDEHNPVLNIGNPGAWDQRLFLPRILEVREKYYMYYTAKDSSGLNWAIGMATSTDSGKTWVKYAGNPVLTKGLPASWDANYVETGSVMLLGETAHMWYDGGTPMGKVGHATAPAFGPLPNPASLNFGNLIVGETKTDSIVIRNPYSIILDITSAVTDLPEQFGVTPSSAVVSAGDSVVFIITYHPAGYEIHHAHALFTHDKEYSPLSVELSGRGVHPSILCGLSAGWNIVSLPLEPSSNNADSIYPSAVSAAFTYDNRYRISDTLLHGIGYWIKYSAPQSIEMYGNFVFSDTFHLSAGWNMVGSLSDTVPVSSIASIPDGLVTSRFFAYSGSGYAASDSILPGYGYWVKVSQAGSLILSSSGVGSSENHITILHSTEMPPPPPGDDLADKGRPDHSAFELQQNYPNPFNPITMIRYRVSEPGRVQISILDILGREVVKLVDEVKQSGEYTVSWNASDSPSGVYFYRVNAGDRTQTRKLLLLR